MRTFFLLCVALSTASCSIFGKKEPAEIPTIPASVSNVPSPPAPAPNLTPGTPGTPPPPPPPPPLSPTATANPSGTVATTDPAHAAAERELNRRKADVSDADDLVSQALRNISEEDKEKAIRKLKEAIKKYPE